VRELKLISEIFQHHLIDNKHDLIVLRLLTGEKDIDEDKICLIKKEVEQELDVAEQIALNFVQSSEGINLITNLNDGKCPLTQNYGIEISTENDPIARSSTESEMGNDNTI